ncbi:putative protein phosphatase 2C 8 [Chlorella vulgaris]
MDEEGAGASSPSRACCGCRFLRGPTKPAEVRRRAVAGSSSSTESGAAKSKPAAPPAEQPATTKPHLTGRRSRSDSPASEDEAQPLKRQNSMGTDDLGIGPPGSKGQPLHGTMSPATAKPTAAAAPGPRSSTQGTPTSTSTQHQSGAVANACPPFGSKSVIGRRAKMEDSCVAVPYLVDVPVSRTGMDELLPPRIAPQLRSETRAGGTSAASDQTVAPASARSGDDGSIAQRQQQQQQESQRGGGGAAALDPASLSLDITSETLHFFGVFDGHGGADAALHCAKSLHERLRDVLTACTVSRTGTAAPGSREQGGASQAAAAAAAAPQDSSSSGISGHLGVGSEADVASFQLPHVGSGNSEFLDATGSLDLQKGLGSSSSSDSAHSCIDADFDGESAAVDVDSRSVHNLYCTAETIEAALAKAFHLTDDEFGNMGGYEHLALVGTTAVVALIGNRMLYVANCGDSRAVLCRSGGALPLTDDHKAAREDETARVEAAGGQILFWNGVRVMGLLAVSRAIGDHSLRPYVIAEPEVTIIARHPSDEVLVMASDGLWDVMNNQEAVTLAKKCLGRARSRGSTRQSAARVAATVLTRAAVDRGSRDNVTVVIVDLSPMTAAELEAEAQLSERSEAATEERSQRARSIQPSAVAVRSSMSASALHAVQGSGTPAAQALQTSPFAPPPVQASPFAAAPTAPSPFAEPLPTETEGEGEGPARAGGAALVSPFSSGALPAGLHFDVQQHAAAVAAAAAAGAPSGQPRNRSKPADGK